MNDIIYNKMVEGKIARRLDGPDQVYNQRDRKRVSEKDQIEK